MLALLNIGPLELLLLGAAAVLLFGGDLPDVARKAARMAGRLRGMTNDLTREFKGHTDFQDQLRRPPELDLPPDHEPDSPTPWRPVSQPPPDTSDASDAESSPVDPGDSGDGVPDESAAGSDADNKTRDSDKAADNDIDTGDEQPA